MDLPKELADKLLQMGEHTYQAGFQRGHTEGWNAAMGKVKAAFETLGIDFSKVSQVTASPFTTQGGATELQKEPRQKAPKGSVDLVVDGALGVNPGGMTPELIVKWGIDNQSIEVSTGSVRNALRDREKNGRAKRIEPNRWAATILAPSDLGLNELSDEITGAG